MQKEYRTAIDTVTEALKNEISEDRFAEKLEKFPKNSIRKLDAGNVTASDETLERAIQYTDDLNDREVKYYREIGSSTGRLPGLITFIKRVIRKLIFFVVQPIVEDINRNREDTVRVLAKLEEHAAAQNAKIVVLEENLKSLQEENEALRKMCEETGKKAED